MLNKHLLLMLKCASKYFYGNQYKVKKKQQHLFETDLFSNNIN